MMRGIAEALSSRRSLWSPQFWKRRAANSRRADQRELQFKKVFAGDWRLGMVFAVWRSRGKQTLSEADIVAPKAADSFPSQRAEQRPAAIAADERSIPNPGQKLVQKRQERPPQKPEDQELARKVAEQAAIEGELADRELRVANLRAELTAFERRYLHLIGARYAELDEYKAQIAERVARQQPGNERAQQAAREARTRADETKSAAGEKSTSEPRAFQATPEMKRLYRDVAKRIHPDLTSDRDDRAKRQHLMAAANQAYEQGDEARLAKILNEYECSPEAVQGEGPGAELVRVIRRLSQARGRLAEIEAEMQQMVRSDLHELKERVSEAEKYGRDVLKEMSEKVDAQIAQARERLENPEANSLPSR